MVLSWSTATWCTSMSSSLTSSTYASSRSNWRLSARYDTRPWRWSMAIAWFRISSKVIATLPTPRRRAQDGVGMGKAGRARYTADGGQKKAAGLAARPGAVPLFVQAVVVVVSVHRAQKTLQTPQEPSGLSPSGIPSTSPDHVPPALLGVQN